MSDDKNKRDRALQRRVRERQAKTGESYQAAWRQLTNAPLSEEPPEIDSDEGLDVDAAVAQVLAHSEQLKRVNEQMFDGTIRVLGEQNMHLHEQVTALSSENARLSKELEEARSNKMGSEIDREFEIAMAAEKNARTQDRDDITIGSAGPTDDVDATEPNARLILPLASGTPIPPHQPTRVTVLATKGAADINQIHVSGAGTPGGASDWIVNDIEIDGRSQLKHKDLSGVLFGHRGVATDEASTSRATTSMSLEGFDPVERDHELALVVTYVGPNSQGSPFFAAAIGKKPPQRPTTVPIASKTPLPLLAKTTISARVQNAPFQVEHLKIDDGNTAGGAADWIVNDLRVNGRSQFVLSGDVPGDLFSTKAIDTFIKLEACEAGSAIELDMIYIGLNEDGAIFTAQLEGTVMRDDYRVPPPDLHVHVETSGQGPGDGVIARCNWRSPASDNSTR